MIVFWTKQYVLNTRFCQQPWYTVFLSLRLLLTARPAVSKIIASIAYT